VANAKKKKGTETAAQGLAARFGALIRERLRARLGVHPVVDLVPHGTLPRTEFKARRVIDDRDLYRQAVQGSRA
jgi:phenylacetate-CoA ligase